VWARTDDPEPLVGTFLVEAGTPGYRVEETWDHLGMRATRSDDVIFDGVVIPEDHAVDIALPAARATAPPPRTSAWNNLTITSVYLGVARSARDWLVRYLHERVPANLGKPLASLPRFESAVGEIEASLAAAGRLVRTTAADIDRADAEAPGAAAAAIAESALVKLSATRASIAAVEAAAALVGNPGLSRGNPLERHYRDVLCSRIHSPQDDTIVAAAGRAALAAAAPVPVPSPS